MIADHDTDLQARHQAGRGGMTLRICLLLGPLILGMLLLMLPLWLLHSRAEGFGPCSVSVHSMGVCGAMRP
ncbi:MAG: hypothetical protein KF914_08795 [Rhizobiaceae bacterium]|nr:hypothetical protein [Rhizobiaceae bacterium]